MKEFTPNLIWTKPSLIPSTFVLSECHSRAFYDFVQQRKGHVYAMKPPSRDDILKVGRTSKNPFLREKTLNTAGVIGEYSLLWSAEFVNVAWAEAEIHKALSSMHETKEFFKVSVQKIKEIFSEFVTKEETILKDLQRDLLLTSASFDEWVSALDVVDIIGY